MSSRACRRSGRVTSINCYRISGSHFNHARRDARTHTLPAPDWPDILARAEADQKLIAGQLRAESKRGAATQIQINEEAAYWAEMEQSDQVQLDSENAARRRFSALFDVPFDEIHPDALCYLMHEGLTDEQLHFMWAAKPWEQDQYDGYEGDFENYGLDNVEPDDERQRGSSTNAVTGFSTDIQALIHPGETAWTLERNAAAAGFLHVDDYLKWRAGMSGTVSTGLFTRAYRP